MKEGAGVPCDLCTPRVCQKCHNFMPSERNYKLIVLNRYSSCNKKDGVMIMLKLDLKSFIEK